MGVHSAAETTAATTTASATVDHTLHQGLFLGEKEVTKNFRFFFILQLRSLLSRHF